MNLGEYLFSALLGGNFQLGEWFSYQYFLYALKTIF